MDVERMACVEICATAMQRFCKHITLIHVISAILTMGISYINVVSSLPEDRLVSSVVTDFFLIVFSVVLSYCWPLTPHIHTAGARASAE